MLCFREFGAGKRQVSYHQQEVIGNLVSHIGSAAHSEVDASLTALYRLCSEDAVAVVSYASTLKGLWVFFIFFILFYFFIYFFVTVFFHPLQEC